MSELLRTILALADLKGTPTFGYDDVRRWPAGALEQLVALGILRAAGRATGLWMDCDDGCYVEPDLREHPDNGDVVAIHNCRRPGCGRLEFPVARFDQWELDFVGAAKAVRKAAGARGRYRELVPDRLWHLGHVVRNGVRIDLFLGRGLAWPDATALLAASEPLSSADAPVLIGYSRLPTGVAWPQRRPGLHTLTDLLKLDDDALVMDRDLLFAVPAGDDGASVWLTVSAAAEMLLKDVSGLDIDRAKARVSKAADAGKFKTNGKKRLARRIERHSFSSWRLEQREADLTSWD